MSSAHVDDGRTSMAESFTGGGKWGEQPGTLKALGDHNLARRIERFMPHVRGDAT